jgi:hypothetical protein
MMTLSWSVSLRLLSAVATVVGFVGFVVLQIPGGVNLLCTMLIVGLNNQYDKRKMLIELM